MKRTPPKTIPTSNPVVKAALSQLWCAILVHWLFQAMVHMDRTERMFKLSVTLFIAVTVGALLGPSIPNLVVGLLVGHTVNFVFNGQINVVLKNFGVSRANEAALLSYLAAFRDRVQSEPSIRFAATYGSYSRAALTDSSDLDIRLVRHPGLVHGLRSCLFVLIERSRALLISGVPLDILVLDDARGLERLRPDERARIMKDSCAVHSSGPPDVR